MAKEIDARYCPRCGEKSQRIEASKANDSDGRLIRYRRCSCCNVTYRTYEIHDYEWQRYRRLIEWARQIVEQGKELERSGDP